MSLKTIQKLLYSYNNYIRTNDIYLVHIVSLEIIYKRYIHSTYCIIRNHL